MVVEEERKNRMSYIIAEIGINHLGNDDIMAKLITDSAEAGADAIKFQYWSSPDVFTSEGQPFYHEFVKNTLTKNQVRNIFSLCKRLGVDCFGTASDTNDLAFLVNNFDMKYIKIGSDDLTNIPLLEFAAGLGKPIILSTGMGTMAEIRNAYNILSKGNEEEVIVMYCLSSYPAKFEDIDGYKMEELRKEFYNTGLSDHTRGNKAALLFYGQRDNALKIFEKHVTLSHKLPGPDHHFSADMKEFAEYCDDIRAMDKMTSNAHKDTESDMRKIARKSLVYGSNLGIGDILDEEWISVKRPGTGIEPARLKEFVNRELKTEVNEGDLLKEEDFE